VPEILAGKFRTTASTMHFAQWGLFLLPRTVYPITDSVAEEREMEQITEISG